MEFNSSDSYFSDSAREKVSFAPSMFSSFIAQSTKFNKSDNDTTDFEKMLKELDEWRHRLNWSRTNADLACNYCGGGIRDLILAYNSIHGYISLLVCVFGSLANILNVAVLTRRDLAAAPINRLLKWLAVADVFVMLEYIPFTVYRYLVLPGQMDFPFSWAAYLLFHMHSTQILHTASISLTLSLAVWRYIAIKYPERSHVLCTERRCSVAILSSFLLPPLLCIPSYLVFDIHTTTIVENSTAIQLYHLDSDYDGKLYQINFWVHAVIVKLLPCLVLTVLSVWLIRALYHANSRKRALKGYNTCSSANNGTNGSAAILTDKASKRQAKYDKRTDRTTRMLLAVLLLFLITEFPQGILGLLSALLGKCFFKRCYDLFGELMDILALLNGAINFILYCCMSRQFRTTFGQLFRPKIMTKRSAGSQTDIQSTYV